MKTCPPHSAQTLSKKVQGCLHTRTSPEGSEGLPSLFFCGGGDGGDIDIDVQNLVEVCHKRNHLGIERYPEDIQRITCKL